VQDGNQSNQAWLRSLMADWQLISDAAFSDLVLWVPNLTKLHSFAHARPSTAATLFYRDITGSVARTDWKKIIDQAWTTGQPVVAPTLSEFGGNASRISAYPVFEPDRTNASSPIAVITRHTNPGESRYPNKLQLNFVACAEQLLEMVTAGKFPLRESGISTRRGAPRVTDGLIRLDQAGLVLFASPNALSMFNRSGLEGELEGRLLAETVSALLPATRHVDEGLPLVLTGKGAWRSDIELPELTIALRSIPISENDERVGAAVLCRDVTELRVGERELLTKDLTIREIHHRVKNNLQTVASLLRIQSRTSGSEEVKETLAQAMRRVSAIAVVHDVLSEGIEQEVSFDLIFDRILQLVPEIATGFHTTVKTSLSGSFGELSTDQATSLALVLTELVANAVEHGLADKAGEILVQAEREARVLRVEVVDSGVGLPEGKVGTGLGTQIVRTLVESELRGKISWTSPIRGGTKVVIELPL
jgi:two-component sensor histidine kinase